jgi:hypothetical protein
MPESREHEVARRHRAGFKLYWKRISLKHVAVGRKPTGKEPRDLIFRMVAENRNWDAPRTHDELRMLGFDFSERTVLLPVSNSGASLRGTNAARSGSFRKEITREEDPFSATRLSRPKQD